MWYRHRPRPWGPSGCGPQNRVQWRQHRARSPRWLRIGVWFPGWGKLLGVGLGGVGGRGLPSCTSHQAPGRLALQSPGPGPVKGVEDRAAGWAASPLSSRQPCMFPGPSPPLSFVVVSGFPQWQRGRWLDSGQGRWQGWNGRAALTREPAPLALPTPQTPGFSADLRSSFCWILGMLRTI